MKTVNLAAKPFVNRRPVIRVAALVWVLGARPLGLSTCGATAIFSAPSRQHRSKLADLESEIGVTEEQNGRAAPPHRSAQARRGQQHRRSTSTG